MRVVISDTAKAEIAGQIAYIRERNPDAARQQRERISRAVARLRQMPRIGKPGRLENTRELLVTGTPFILIYEIAGDRIDIIHILHGRQQWPPQEDDEN
jgi:toxin ParE1/3/4